MEILSNGAKAEPVYALPTQLKNSPVYCSSIPGKFISREPDNIKQNGGRLNQIATPEILSLIDEFPGDVANKVHLIDSINIARRADGVLELDSLHPVLRRIFGNSRHFVIPFPGSFLNVNANCRGDIDETNSFARQTKHLANTVEFLLSAKGIKFAWAGILPGEELPKNLRPKLKEGEKPPKKYEAKKPIPRCVVDELQDLMVQNDAEDENGAKPTGIVVVPEAQTMSVNYLGPSNFVETVEIPRFLMHWEFVPLFNMVNIHIPEKLRKVFPDHLLLDSETPLGYLLCHVDILDPHLDLMIGMKRLYARRLLKEEKGMSNQCLDALAAKYSIEPRAYVTTMAMLMSNESIASEMAYEAPNISIFRNSEPLNICNILGVKPLIEDGKVLGPNNWRNGFSMKEFEKEKFRDVSDPGIPEEENRLQLQYHKHYYRTYDDLWFYCFPSPNRVIRIDAAQVYPTILNKCIIPFYNKSTKRKINLDIQFTPSVTDIQFPWNVTCPDMEFRSSVMLEEQLRQLVNEDSYVEKKEDAQPTTYAVDSLREHLPGGDLFSESFTASIKENEIPPIVTAKMISEFLIRDIERNPHCPAPIAKIFEYMKMERKRDTKFSLFHDLFDKNGLDFKYYDDLSIASTYCANTNDFIDWYYAMYQSHRHFMLLDKVIMTGSRLRFKDQLYVTVMGESNNGKSFTKDTALKLAIPGSLREQDSETKKVKESGVSFAGFVMIKDDMGAANSDMYDGEGDEAKADAVFKSALSMGYSKRDKYDKDTGQVLYIFTDLRRSVWGNSNAETGIAASILSRTLLIHVSKCDRFLSMAQLDMRIQQTDSMVVNNKREIFTAHYRNKQIFCTLVFYFARGGGIQYDYTKEGRAVVSHMLKRFKDIFSKNILKRSGIPITSRMEQGQIYPIAEGIMLERVFATICSGVWKDKTKHLYPGAPFSYEMLEEMNQLGILLPIEEDVLRAVSYYEDIASQEVTQEIVNFLRYKFAQKKARRGILGLNNMDFLLVRDIAVNQHHFTIPGASTINERGWERHWGEHQDIFFSRHMGGEIYVTDFNWIDLVKLCDLPNNLTSQSYLVDQFAEAVINYNPNKVYLDKNVVRFHLEHMLVNEDGTNEFNEIVTRTVMSYGAVPELRDTKQKSPILGMEMQVNSEGKDRSSTKTKTLTVRTLWLRAQLKEAGAVHKTVCYPYPNEDGEVSGTNFLGSTCEAAIQLAASHEHAFEQTILLDGMRFHRCAPHDGETREIKDMPHIMKQVRIIDTTKEVDNDNYRKYIANKFQRLNVEPGLVVRFDEKTGQGEVFAKSEENQFIEKEWDYFSTKVYLQRILDRMRAYGHYSADGKILRDDDQIKEEFMSMVMNERIYQNFSPVGAELLFKAQRAAVEKESGVQLKDYQSSKIEAEIALTNSAKQKAKKRTSTFADFMRGIIGQKRPFEDTDSESMSEDPHEEDVEMEE